MKYVLVLCSLLAVVWSGQAWAANRYVDGTLSVTCTGSTYSIASRNCTGADGTGYKTIPEGIRALVKSDVLNIRAGTYVVVGVYGNVASDTYGCQSGGCPTSWATATIIQNYPGEAVVMQTEGFSMDNTRSTGGVGYLIWRGDTRANFINEQRAGQDATGFRPAKGAHHIRMTTMTIRNFTNAACIQGGSVAPASAFVEITNNQISNCGDDTNKDHGIYPSLSADWLVDRNYFFANQGYGIHFNGGTTVDGEMRATITNNIIEGRRAGATLSASCIVVITGSGHRIFNNVCIGLGGGSVRFSGGIELWGGSTQTGTQVYHNTVYDVVGWGIQISNSSVSGTIVRNNIFSSTPTPITDLGTGTTKSNNHCTVVTPGCVTPGAVGFVSAGTGDFSLTSTSTALNMGVAIAGIPYNTYTGKTVPDAGAFESFGFSTATINDVLMDVTLGMNLNVPILPATGITGFTVACSGGSNCGTPVVASAIKKAGSDSIVRLTISGMGGVSHVCEVGQTWTVTYTPGNVTDSTLIANTSTQKMFGFTTKPVTNACASVPPVTSTITLEGTAVQSQNPGTGTTVALQCGTNDNRFVFVAAGVYDNTNSITGITYNGVALTQVGTKVGNPSGNITGQAFYLANAASGSNTLSVTLNASDSWTIVASCRSGVDSSVPIGTPVTATSINAAGSITATASGVTDGVVVDAVTKNVYTTACTEDASQTEVVADGRTDSANLRTQSSEKTGVGSVVMTWTGCTAFGSETIIAVPVYPATTPTPPAVGTFTQAAHRISSAYTKGGIEQPLSAISAANTSIRAGVPFAVTTQLDCTGNDCDPVGLRLRYSRNGSPFVRVPDVMDSTNNIAFIGNIASNQLLQGAVACCLSGALTPIDGTTQLTMDATPVVDLAQNASTVQRRVLVLGPDAVNGDTYDFEEYNQDLNPLDAYVPSGGARITVSTTQIAQVTGLHLVGPTAHSTLVGLVWSPSTDLFLQGYKVYRSTTSGVYGEAVHTITEATAGATMSPMTQWIHNEPVADTYYFVVTAFDWGGLESIVSSEVSVVKTGQGARRTR